MSELKRTKTNGIPKVNVTKATHQLINRIGAIKGWNKITTVERIAKYFADSDADVASRLSSRSRQSA